MLNINPSLPSSSATLDCSRDTSVDPITTPLLNWVWKTLEYVGSNFGIHSDNQWTRFEFSVTTKVLATYGPYTYAQAKDKTKLEKSMTSECNSLTKNKTWTLIPLSHGNNLVGCKCIYKTKFTLEGNIENIKLGL